MKAIRDFINKLSSPSVPAPPPYRRTAQKDHPPLEMPYDTHVELSKDKIPLRAIQPFPEQIWENIFSYCSLTTLYSSSRVCAAFYEPCKQAMNEIGRSINGTWSFDFHLQSEGCDYSSTAILELQNEDVLIGKGQSPYGGNSKCYTLLGCKYGNTISVIQHYGVFDISHLMATYYPRKESTKMHGTFVSVARFETQLDQGAFAGLRSSALPPPTLQLEDCDYMNWYKVAIYVDPEAKGIVCPPAPKHLKRDYSRLLNTNWNISFNYKMKSSKGKLDFTINISKVGDYGAQGKVTKCSKGSPNEANPVLISECGGLRETAEGEQQVDVLGSTIGLAFSVRLGDYTVKNPCISFSGLAKWKSKDRFEGKYSMQIRGELAKGTFVALSAK